MKPITSLVRIKLRVEAMRAAGAWFLNAINENPSLKGKFRDDTFKFIASFSQRSGSFVEIERDFAWRFIVGWKTVIPPSYLLQLRPCTTIPVDGLHAIAEIIMDMQKTLSQRKGRPDNIDPVEAYELNQKTKTNRARGRSEYSHELVAEHFGVSNKGLISRKVSQGRKLVEFINENTEYLKD